MSDDPTKKFDGPELLRQILVKLEVLDTRLQAVEKKVEERGFDTKPIWEKALTEIMEVNQRLTGVDRKIDVFSKDMLNIRADQLGLNERVERLEEETEDSGSIRTIG